MFSKKRIIIGSLIILFITIISIFALIPIEKSYETNAWMKEVDDNTLITNMSIPGSHDSGATHSIFDVAGKCQDLSIKTQLTIGVRFLDLRLQLVNNEFKIVHSFVDQKLKFSKVLNDIDNFLSKYDSEFIIMSIKEDNSSKDSTINFNEALLTQLLQYDKITLNNTLPNTLKEARGKIYILNRFTSQDIGIAAYYGWQDSTTFDIDNLHIQDN